MKLVAHMSALALVFAAVSARAEKPYEVPECASIAKDCQAAKYEIGRGAKPGKNMWPDCIGKIAQGGKAEGVSGHTQEEARKCAAAAKAKRMQNQKGMH